jgi:protein TonB
LVAAMLTFGLVFRHPANYWGSGLDAHSIQATAVSAIPLPSDQPLNDNVLATETPSPAPPVETKTEAKPVPEAIPIPVKNTKPVKTAEKTTPAPAKHVQPTPVKPNVVPYGEQGGLRVAVSTAKTDNGSVSAFTSDSDFGSRYKWYVDAMTTRISQNWYKQEADPGQSTGHTVTVTYDILRDGTVTGLHVEKPSGVSSLDTSAMRALQRIESFNALPNGYSGNRVSVEFEFTYGAK